MVNIDLNGEAGLYLEHVAGTLEGISAEQCSPMSY
jgi:hypothetical protein